MTTMTMKMTYRDSLNTTAVPVTARGRSLYTVGWFLNGMPVNIDHDNSQSSLRDITGNT